MSYGGYCQGILTGVDWSVAESCSAQNEQNESNFLRSFCLKAHIKLHVNTRYFPVVWIQIFEKWYLLLMLWKYVACLLEARIVKPEEREPLLGNGSVNTPVARSWLSSRQGVSRAGGWCEMAVSLRGRETGSRGTSTVRTLLFVW
jgi:hypothetical protein